MRIMQRLSMLCSAPLLLGFGVEAPERDVWYRPPSSADSRPPEEKRYAPLGVLVEPQLAVHNLRGGTLTSVLASLPLNPYVGIAVGGVFADTARFSGGIDFLRYAGLELPIARGTMRSSVVLAPTFGAASIFAGSIVAGDAWTAPLGIRAVVEAAHVMAELRVSGHLLVGGEVGTEHNAKTLGTAETLGLQLVIAPLFVTTGGGTVREEAR
jgi:hypothetical protein